jgi:CHASE3 domain sensor protein
VITRDAVFLVPYNTANAAVAKQIKSLREHIADDAVQQ